MPLHVSMRECMHTSTIRQRHTRKPSTKLSGQHPTDKQIVDTRLTNRLVHDSCEQSRGSYLPAQLARELSIGVILIHAPNPSQGPCHGSRNVDATAAGLGNGMRCSRDANHFGDVEIEDNCTCLRLWQVHMISLYMRIIAVCMHGACGLSLCTRMHASAPACCVC
jgi:hypothetical protein